MDLKQYKMIEKEIIKLEGQKMLLEEHMMMMP
jgi:hypothetical protein